MIAAVMISGISSDIEKYCFVVALKMNVKSEHGRSVATLPPGEKRLASLRLVDQAQNRVTLVGIRFVVEVDPGIEMNTDAPGEN